jgi:hypothetical protein
MFRVPILFKAILKRQVNQLLLNNFYRLIIHAAMIRNLIIIMVSFLLVAEATGQEKSKKRGIGYGYHSEADISAVSSGLSWWYNWYYQPENSVKNVYTNYNMEFVPMIWGDGSDFKQADTVISQHSDIVAILGFNEPNFSGQANLTPRQAAEAWPKIEAIADKYQLKIGSPAVNYCGTCVEDGGIIFSDPVEYLDSFFAACAGCQVDFITVHWYACDVGALQWYIGLFKKYKKPIWLTEFACWEGNSITYDIQKSYLIGAVDYLENDTSVERYAWFTGRSNGGPFIDLLAPASGVLSSLGEIYVNMPVHDTGNYCTLPARIEAESYASMSGILIEATQDTDGFANVGWIDAGDWLEYKIDVPAAQEYFGYYRISSTANASIDIQVDSVSAQTLAFPSTGGWQSWKTIENKIELTQGRHTIRLKANSANFNINWFELSDEAIILPSNTYEQDLSAEFKIYPNPSADGNITVLFSKEIKNEISVRLINSMGSAIWEERKAISGNSLTVNLSIPAGIYLLEVVSGADKSFKRLVILNEN